jgi:hypothetical protein
MQLLVEPHDEPCDAETYSITRLCSITPTGWPSADITDSATHGAIVGGWSTNDFTHGSPSHIKPSTIGFVDVHEPVQFAGGSKGVTKSEESS